ncbi:MAG: hypothetical protein RLZZ200_1444 [Pseudomonadota bacterium]|jgi:hypothetical protein
MSNGIIPGGAAGNWLNGDALQPLREINGQCIELLCAMAERGEGSLPLLQSLSPLWRMLSRDARQRLASCPWLLVDAGFGDATRWRQLTENRVGDQPREWRVPCLGGDRGLALARRVMTYGWHLARSNRSAARIVLGMSPANIERIGSLSLRELDIASEYCPGWVRPRWENQVAVWRRLLSAASGADEPALQRAGLHGIQLIAAGMLPSGPPVNSRA